MYPKVYDKLETDFTTNGLAILNKVYDLRIYERLNGEYTLSFFMPLDEKFQYVEEENYIKINDQLFIIRYVTDGREEAGSTLAYVECEHIFFELIDKFIESFETNFDTAQFILDRLLFETRFTGDATQVEGSKSFSITKRKAVSGINSILDRWNCELERDNFNVTLKPQIGVVRPAEFKYSKNLRSIKRIKDSFGVITRLYVYGQNGISIPPIDSPNIGLYPVPKEEEVTFGNVTSETTLQEQGEAYLAQVDTPKVSYEISVIELKTLTGYEDEEFKLGDTVTVIDEDLGINISSRIIEYEEYPFEPHRSSVVLANFIDNIADDMASLRDSKRRLDQITDNTDRVGTYWLEGVIDVLRNKFDSAQSNWYTDDEGNLIFEALDGTSAMKLAGEGFAIANSKVSGIWQWTTFGTGQGFTADLINAGILNAALVKIMGGNYVSIDGNGFHVVDPLNNERVRAGQIGTDKYGIKVTEGELYSTLIQTGAEGATTYIRLTPEGDFEAVRNGNRTIFMQASPAEGRIRLYDSGGIETTSLEAIRNFNNGTYTALRAISGVEGLLLSAPGGRVAVEMDPNQEFYVDGHIYATGELRAGQGKPAIIETKTYGKRAFFAIEASEVKFKDEGIATLKSGVCRIDLDPIFLEGIEPNTPETPWIIRVDPFGWVEVRVVEVGNDYFIVEERDRKDEKFAWELTATRIGFKGTRLPER